MMYWNDGHIVALPPRQPSIFDVDPVPAGWYETHDGLYFDFVPRWLEVTAAVLAVTAAVAVVGYSLRGGRR